MKTEDDFWRGSKKRPLGTDDLQAGCERHFPQLLFDASHFVLERADTRSQQADLFLQILDLLFQAFFFFFLIKTFHFLSSIL